MDSTVTKLWRVIGVDAAVHGLVRLRDGARRSLASHLLGTAAHLQNWGAASHVVRAGLAHSAYGRAAFGDAALLQHHQSHHREALADVVGDDAEALVGLFATLVSVATLLDEFDRQIVAEAQPDCDPPVLQPDDRQREGSGDDANANTETPTFRIEVRARRHSGAFATDQVESRTVNAGTLAELLLLTWASAAEQRRVLGVADGGSDREQLDMLKRQACVQLMPLGAVAELTRLFSPRSTADGGNWSPPGLATLFGLGRNGIDGADGDAGSGGATASGGALRTARDMARSMLTGDLRRRHFLHRGNGDVGRFTGLVQFEIGATLALPSSWTDVFIRSPTRNLTRAVRAADAFHAQAFFDAGQTIYQHGVDSGEGMAEWLVALERELGLAAGGTQLAAFASPASPASGTQPHFDLNDNIILQVAGHKRWRIYSPAGESEGPSSSQVIARPSKPGLVGGRAVPETVGGRSAASLAEAIPPGQPWGPLRNACSSDILLAPGDAMWIPSGTVHAVLETPGLDEIGPENGGTGSSLHYNVQLATIGLGDIAAWYLAWKVDLGPPGASLSKPFTAKGPDGADPAAGGARSADGGGTSAVGVGRLGVETASQLVDLLQSRLAVELSASNLRSRVIADEKMFRAMARHSGIPFGNLTGVLLRDGGAPRCTLVDVGRHFLSARIQLNAEPRLRAAAVFPFGSDGRLTVHAAAELAALLKDVLARSLTVERVRDRITLAVTSELKGLFAM